MEGTVLVLHHADGAAGVDNQHFVRFHAPITRVRDKYCIAIKKTEASEGASVVVLPGFEPRQAEPKSDVLPLHHRTFYGLLRCGYVPQKRMQKYYYFSI